MRKRFLIMMVVGLLASFVSPVLAANNVVHYTVTGTTTFSGSLEELGAQGCVGYSGTMTISEDAILHVTEFVDGPNAGRFHVIAEYQAQLTITPDDPALGPAYTGTHQGTGRLTFKDDDNTVGSYNQRIEAIGEDESRLRYNMHGHVVRRNGEFVISLYKVTCIP